MSSAIYRDWLWEAYIRFTDPPTVDDYQVRIPLDYLHGMNPDLSDIRFTDISGRVLSYNIIEYTASTSATVDILVHNQDTGINIYYGNSIAKDASDPSSVYLGSDDFNRADSGDIGSDWNETGNYSIASNILSNSTANQLANYNQHTSSDYVVEATFYDPDDGDFTSSDKRFGIDFYVQSATALNYNSADRYYVEFWPLQSQFRLWVYDSGWIAVGSIESSKVLLHGDRISIDTSTVDIGLKIYRNGSLWSTIDAGDSTFASGYAGIGIGTNAGTVAVDDFRLRKSAATEPTSTIVTIIPNLANYSYDTIIIAGIAYSDTLAVNGEGSIILSDIQAIIGTVSVTGEGTQSLSDIVSFTDLISLTGHGTALLEDAATYSDTITVNGVGDVRSLDFSATLEGVALIISSQLIDKVYVNEIRYLIKVDCGEDVTTATAQYISVRKPDGSVVNWSALVAEDNYIQHSTAAGDIDQDGIYRVQSVVMLDGKLLLGNTDRFKIYPNHG